MSTEREELLALMDLRLRQQSRRWLFGAALAAAVLVPGVRYASSVTVPHTFSAGAVARASDVNENFAALTAEATRVSNIVSGPGDGTNTNRVVNLAAPVAANEAANRAYVDASGGAGGSSVTLIGVTACPTGWTSALTGTALFTYATYNYGGAGASPGNPSHVCAANATQSAGGTTAGLYASLGTSQGLGWAAPVTAAGPVPCVICVK